MQVEILIFVVFVIGGSNVLAQIDILAQQSAALTPQNDTTIASVLMPMKSRFKRWFCYNGSVPDPIYKDQCCSYEYNMYTARWVGGGYYLTTILERLQRWNCDQSKTECTRPTWPFTEFTRLAYDRFCNRSKLEGKCLETVRKIAEDYSFLKSTSLGKEPANASWPALIETLKSPDMKLSDLAKPCVQVALFDRKDGGVGRFHEIVEPFLPFCGLQWSGYDYYTAMNREVSPWTGLSSWCRGSIKFCQFIMGVLCVGTILGNAVIIAVFSQVRRMRNGQAVYKISLAIADLMVGLVVWPNMFVLQNMAFVKPRMMGDLVPRPSAANGSWLAYFPFGNKGMPHRFAGAGALSPSIAPYVGFLGFFTTLGLTVSIYTLLAASFDRLWAVLRPLSYNKLRSMRYAKIVCFVTWLIAILTSALPIGVEAIKYKVISAIFVSSEGPVAMVLILIAVLLPLLVTWVVAFVTFAAVKNHSKNHPAQAAPEKRVFQTLLLMVGVFSLCILPVIVSSIAGLVVPGMTWSDPQNINLHSTTVYTTVEYVAFIILASNSLWNVIIYSFRTVGFRKAAFSVLLTALNKTCIAISVHCVTAHRNVTKGHSAATEETCTYNKNAPSAVPDAQNSPKAGTKSVQLSENDAYVTSTKMDETQEPFAIETVHPPADE